MAVYHSRSSWQPSLAGVGSRLVSLNFSWRLELVKDVKEDFALALKKFPGGDDLPHVKNP